jgi:hypothetical protein
MTPEAAIADACPKVRDLGWAFYFVPETLARGKELGLDGLRFWLHRICDLSRPGMVRPASQARRRCVVLRTGPMRPLRSTTNRAEARCEVREAN